LWLCVSGGVGLLYGFRFGLVFAVGGLCWFIYMMIVIVGVHFGFFGALVVCVYWRVLVVYF